MEYLIYVVIVILLLIELYLVITKNRIKERLKEAHRQIGVCENRMEFLKSQKAELVANSKKLDNALTELREKYDTLKNQPIKDKEYKPVSKYLLEGDLMIKEAKTNRLVSSGTVNIKIENDTIKYAFIMKGGSKVRVIIYSLK